MQVTDLILQQADIENQDRLERIRKAWKAYYGDHPKSVRVKPGAPDDNIRLNYPRLIVDKGVDFLFGQPIGFEPDTGPQSAEAAWLDRVWRANYKQGFLTKIGINGSVCGHAFCKIMPAVQSGGLPRIVPLDPATITTLWNPEDFEDVEAYIVQWNAIDPANMQPLVRRQTIWRNEQRTSWSIADEVSRGNATSFTLLSEATWPWAWSPIFHCQNLPAPNAFWGLSDLENDIIDVSFAINAAVSNINRILRFHAHPKTIAVGVGVKQMDVGIDGVIHLPTNSNMRNLEMSSDLASSITFYEKLREAWHELARIPEVATGKLDKTGNLSGVALEILYRPLIELINRKRLFYGEMLADLNNKLLLLAGFGDQQVVTHWPNVLPINAKEEAETYTILRELGVSQETILTKLGYDAALEAEKKQQEQASAAGLGAQVGAHLLTQFERGAQA